MTASLHPDRYAEVRHFHLFCGLAGGAAGFNAGHARVGNLVARFRCIGGVDVDRAAVADFGRLAGVPGTVLDLFDRPQYRAFHGHEPPAGWREATADDLRAAAGGERPHIIFTSPPCKGFSGLLSEGRAGAARYQALNRLTVRGVRLAIEAWADDPPEFFLLENVPRIATRGRPLVDEIVELLEAAGYAVAETAHDCGELGGLAQSRRRFLLVARHRAKVPPFLYEPPKRRLRGVGEVLGAFPLPSDPVAGPMHRMRELQWKTWVRLAFVEAGGDWRSLERLRVVDGMLADYGIAPEADYHRGSLGVTHWSEPTGTVTAGGRPGQGRFSVADPRPFLRGEYGQLGVKRWDEPASAISGQSLPGGGRYSVADPRLPPKPHRHLNQNRVEAWDGPAHTIIGATRPGSGAGSVADPRLGPGPCGPHFYNVYRVVPWSSPASTVTAGSSPSAGGLSVADPRAEGWGGRGKYRVTAFQEPAGAVIAASATGNGAFAVADPRAGNYGVIPWDAPAGAVTGAASADSGRFSVADPRRHPCESAAPSAVSDGASSNACVAARQGVEPASPDTTCALPPPPEARLVAIRSFDGTWHRPFTTLELAALQGLVEPNEHLQLEGHSDSAWRERIGTAVPKPAAAAIASVMGRALLLAWAGETFALRPTPIWVRPLVVAVAVDVPELRP